MKKILIVSDFNGTINRATSSDYEMLKLQFSALRQKHNAEEIIFSLCIAESDKASIEKYFIDVFYGLRNSDIRFGKQFYEQGYMKDLEFYDIKASDDFNKIDTIINYTKELLETEEVVALYYIDDIWTRKCTNGYIESALNNQIPFHFINPGASQMVSHPRYSASMLPNIRGVIEGLNYQLGEHRISDQERINGIIRQLKEKQEQPSKAEKGKVKLKVSTHGQSPMQKSLNGLPF